MKTAREVITDMLPQGLVFMSKEWPDRILAALEAAGYVVVEKETLIVLKMLADDGDRLIREQFAKCSQSPDVAP